MTSEQDLPRRYMGAIIGNGYIISEDPGVHEDDLYTRLLTAADDDDHISRAILDSLPISQYETVYTRSKYGVALRFDRHRVVLTHAHYPPSFSGKCLPELQRRALDGHFTAQRLVTLLTRHRMLDPEFQIVDPGR